MSLEIPVKNAELQWAVWDSARLNDFPFRNDDIVIGTWSKSGTTWIQQLVAQLVFEGDPDVYGQAISPWIEFRLASKEEMFAMAEAQTHRRFLKTHSPFNCIPYRPDLKYLFIGRDARDVAWSMHNHECIMHPEAFAQFNDAPGRVGPPWRHVTDDAREYYLRFLEHGYFPGMSPDTEFWSCIRSWWQARELPNVMLLHFNDLKRDFVREARNVAEFLEIEIAESLWPAIEKHCRIDYMREQARKFDLLDEIFEGGGARFIHKGTNGRWRDVLSPAEIERCDDVAEANLGRDCAAWLKTGGLSRSATASL